MKKNIVALIVVILALFAVSSLAALEGEVVTVNGRLSIGKRWFMDAAEIR